MSSMINVYLPTRLDRNWILTIENFMLLEKMDYALNKCSENIAHLNLTRVIQEIDHINPSANKNFRNYMASSGWLLEKSLRTKKMNPLAKWLYFHLNNLSIGSYCIERKVDINDARSLCDDSNYGVFQGDWVVLWWFRRRGKEVNLALGGLWTTTAEGGNVNCKTPHEYRDKLGGKGYKSTLRTADLISIKKDRII
jgi:hypothetical protein